MKKLRYKINWGELTIILSFVMFALNIEQLPLHFIAADAIGLLGFTLLMIVLPRAHTLHCAGWIGNWMLILLNTCALIVL